MQMKDSKAVFLSLVIESEGEGYLAQCPGIQGAFAEGDTIEEAIFNCVDVIKMIASYRAERGERLGFNEWNEDRVKRVLAHYENQTESEAIAEDESAWEDTSQTFIEVPNDIVPFVRELIARKAS
jgi:predicted RNase H-like HicB family nuclease